MYFRGRIFLQGAEFKMFFLDSNFGKSFLKNESVKGTILKIYFLKEQFFEYVSFSEHFEKFLTEKFGKCNLKKYCLREQF